MWLEVQAYRDRVCAAGACHGDAPCRTGRRRTHPYAWQVWRGADRGGSTGDVASPPVTSAQATTYTRRCVRRYGQSWHGFCLFPPGRDRTQERDHAPCTVVEDVGIRRPAQRGGLGRDRVYRSAVPQVRQQADRTLAFGPLSAMPEASIGRTVILGGEGVGPLVWGPLGVATASPALMALASPSSSPEVAAAWTPIID